MIYDLNHCAHKTAGYNCKFVYKTLSIQRSFVFASGTPTPIVVDLFGESTITVVNKYSAFRCKSGYSKGGVQRQNSPIQFTTRICALNGRKLILAKTMPCAASSHSLSMLFILSSTDTHFTVVVAKSCTHFVVVKQLCHSGRRVERRQVSDDVYIHRWSETTSFRFVFTQCCYPYVHSRCEKDMKVVVALSSF